MKLVLTSDIHGHLVKTPPGDVLIVAGDLTKKGTRSELSFFEQWLTEQPQKHKIWIAGNHDFGLVGNVTLGKLMAKRTKSHYLYENTVDIDGVRFYGSPWTPWYHGWAFNYRMPTDRWNKMPHCDVLVTHGPPHGILDINHLANHVGCEDLMSRINLMNKKPKVHVFGHIHENYGQFERDGVHFINASACNGRYHPINPPIVVDI